MGLVENIKEAALKQHMTIVDVALELGFSENAIYRWNTNQPSIDKVQRVADLLECSVDDLIK